jgi:hypothetical protein
MASKVPSLFNVLGHFDVVESNESPWHEKKHSTNQCVEEEQETLVSLQWPDHDHEEQQTTTQRASKMDDATPPNTFTLTHTHQAAQMSSII